MRDQTTSHRLDRKSLFLRRTERRFSAASLFSISIGHGATNSASPAGRRAPDILLFLKEAAGAMTQTMVSLLACTPQSGHLFLPACSAFD